MLPSLTLPPRATQGGTLRQHPYGLDGLHRPAPSASPASEGMDAGAGAAAAAFGSAQLVKIELLQERYPHVELERERRHFSAILRAASAANGSLPPPPPPPPPPSEEEEDEEEGRVNHQAA